MSRSSSLSVAKPSGLPKRPQQTQPILAKALQLGLGALGVWLSCVAVPKPAWGASQIYISYGLLERSISIDALEAYARTGAIDDDLAVYTQYADPQQLEQLRSILLAQIEVTPVAISQFLYTPQGEILLDRLGLIVQTGSRQSGFYAIRSALILAAAHTEGLTLLNVLRQFPTQEIRIDLGRSLQTAGELGRFVGQNAAAVEFIAQQSAVEGAAEPFAGLQLPDLRRQGVLSWRKETITLIDRTRPTLTATSRERILPVDVYLPSQLNQPAPVIVISHGLGSDRTTFEYLAEHLASYGFAVAVPDHPGSSSQQLQALLQGVANEVSEPIELLDRPLDIKFLLDELEQRTQSDPLFKGQLNLQQVGILGQSFGGYTALVSAGASLNFQQVQADCPPGENTLNLSLLLQCRARLLNPPNYELQDSRIKAVFAINPVGSVVFGPAGLRQLQVPTLIMASGGDTVAPAVPEQILPFTWLNTPDKYLVLIRGGTHFSTLGQSENEAIPLPPQAIGPAPFLARRYLSALSVGFFKTYIANQPEYRPFLSASYAAAMSQSPLALYLLQSLPATELAKAIGTPPPPPEP